MPWMGNMLAQVARRLAFCTPPSIPEFRRILKRLRFSRS